MSKSKLFGWIIGVVALGLVLRFVIFAPQTPDKELIQAALKDAVRAGKEGRAGSVIDLMSKQMTVNDGTQVNLTQIANYVKQNKPDVEFSNQNPSINGDKAIITSDVRVSLGLPSMAIDIKNVELEFEKENTTRWLVIPDKKWQLKNVRVPEESLASLADTASGLSGFPGVSR